MRLAFLAGALAFVGAAIWALLHVHQLALAPSLPGEAKNYEAQPPRAPPYVVAMQSHSNAWRTLHREGWTRTEHDRAFRLESADGFSYSLSFDGARLASIDLGRGPTGKKDRRSFGHSDTVLGEACEVWASRPPFEERVHGGPWLECITTDGIVLWVGRAPPGGPDIRIHTRAVSLDRRVAAWSELLPPREVLSWDYWVTHFPIPPDSASPAYEVRFPPSTRQIHPSLPDIQRPGAIKRVRGDLLYDGRSGGGFWLRNASASLRYFVGGDRLDGLSIEVEPQRISPHPLAGGSELMNREALRLFGETCAWHRVDLGVRWGVVIRCVTEDGIMLAEATDYDDPARTDEYEVASYFQRRAPPAESMMLPADAFDPWIEALPE